MLSLIYNQKMIYGLPKENTSSFSPKAILNAFLLLNFIFLISCGSGSTDLYCSPNYSQGGLALKVSYLVGSLNTYEFEVCYNDSAFGEQVSVYGVETFADIATINTGTDVRLAHISDNLNPGDRFTVTFSNDDTWFVIYEDDVLGNLDNTNELIKGEFR